MLPSLAKKITGYTVLVVAGLGSYSMALTDGRAVAYIQNSIVNAPEPKANAVLFGAERY
jgi:hypothetical protein